MNVVNISSGFFIFQAYAYIQELNSCHQIYMEIQTTPSPLELAQQHPFDPQSLLNALKKTFPDTFNKKVGVWEGYSLEQHTLMVLRQFEKYFAARTIPGGLSTVHFRYFLAVHDLGKPDWVDGGKRGSQAEFNLKVFSEHFPAEPFIANEQRKLLESFLSDDPIGSFIKLKREKENPSPEDLKSCLTTLQQMLDFSGSGLSRSEYLSSLLVYYLSDAGSYTVDAGGLKSLDHLFEFGEGVMDFSPSIKRWVDAVRERFV